MIMDNYENILAKAKQAREDFPDSWFRFVKESNGYYQFPQDYNVRLEDFYRWVCKQVG